MNYSKMKDTRTETILLDKWIKVPWNGRNIPYYQNIGYKYTKHGDMFLCRIEDLSHGSAIDVHVRCPVCKETRYAMYTSITKAGHTLCTGCAKRIDLAGIRFGRLIALKPDESNVTSESVYWICECDCGTTKSIAGSSLTKGMTTSCGCYSRERKRTFPDQTGEKNPNWNPNKTDEERIKGHNYPELKEWRTSVYERDAYTCQVCLKRGGKLAAHHLYSHASYPELRLDISNGITLCKTHHLKFHGWMGGCHVPCALDDFQKWLRLGCPKK